MGVREINEYMEKLRHKKLDWRQNAIVKNQVLIMRKLFGNLMFVYVHKKIL